ncbi:hypothetical protein SNEBB_003977 [Seison nebaliae]|nr:hypothetical protein SNEBB_003977 [Seison nebaliae]
MSRKILGKFRRLILIPRYNYSNYTSTLVDIKDVSSKDAGQLYSVSNEIFKKINVHGKSVEKDYLKFVECVQGQNVLLRHSMIEIIGLIRNNELKKIENEELVPKFLLFGQLGNGKTMNLLIILNYLHSLNKHFVVHFGDGIRMLKYPKELVECEYEEDMWEMNIDCLIWLNALIVQNRKYLDGNDIRFRKKLNFTDNEFLENNSSLEDLVKFANSRPKYASHCASYFLDTIEQDEFDKTNQFAIVIDGMNGVKDGGSRHHRNDHQKSFIPMNRIRIAQSIKNLLTKRNSKFNNRIIVGSVCEKAENKGYFREEGTPLNLLGTKFFEEFEPFIPFNVPRYSSKEFHTIVDYLIDENWLRIDTRTSQDLHDELSFLSAHSPLELFRIGKSH